jgi:hypothetical protein
MKGQIRVEFIFGVVAFAVIIFFIFSQLNIIFTAVVSDSKIDSLKSEGIGVINSLTQNKGDPEDWESQPTVNRIGLAIEPYKLSLEKINKLKSNCDLLDIFELDGYQLEIYNSDEQILFCGFPGKPKLTIFVSRSVFIEGEHGNISLELW